MATTQYTGARYVPLFADPFEWDNKREFEPLTIVQHNGASYTSRQYVPKGIDILNDEFWALTGNYNAQVEQYRKEVLTFNDRINNAQGSADKAQVSADKAQKDVADFEQTFNAKFPLKTDDLGKGIVTDAKLATDSVTEQKVADGAVSTVKLADGAVSTVKLADDSVTEQKITPASVTNEKLDVNSVAESNLQAGSVSSAKIKPGAVNTAAIADGAVTTSKLAAGAIVNDKLDANSVASGNIQDGAITATKISNTAINSILNGFTIKRFDSTDTTADNDGLLCPSGTVIAGARLAGFYIVELQLLVINSINLRGATFEEKVKNLKLPNYVARPASGYLQLADYALTVYKSGEDFSTWTGLRYSSDGYIYPNSTVGTSQGTSAALTGSIVCYLRPFSAGSEVTGNAFNAYAEQNGVI